MRCVDVNILVFAHRPESPDHDRYLEWLTAALAGGEPLGLADAVLAGFLRIVTHPRVFREPTPTAVALEFLDVLLASPAALRIGPGGRHWSIFTDLCQRLGVTGNGVPDAYLAALAIAQGASWVTADRGFARYPGLRVLHPLDS